MGFVVGCEGGIVADGCRCRRQVQVERFDEVGLVEAVDVAVAGALEKPGKDNDGACV